MIDINDKITAVNSIADRMKQAREAAGLTQPQLAKKAGVSPGTIGNIESGTRKQPRELLAIAAALRVTPTYLPCPAPHSPSTFALRVKGDSMTAPYGRSYPDGCIIYVDPERRSPVNGDRIVACLMDAGDHEVTFKIYKNEDGRQWLAPLNTQHPPLFERFTVLGTVIGKWEDG